MADTLRDEFEIWARDLFGKFYPLTKDEDGYKDKVTRFAYMAFKAGRVSRPTDAEVWARLPGSIGAQEFLRWNRSQSIPLVAIPMEMGVYRKAIEIHKATSNMGDEAPKNLYTCQLKGGEYELLGIAKGAGTSSGSAVVVYQDAANSLLYYRTPGNFDERMKVIDCSLGTVTHKEK